jgi:fructose-bisphosphate aldolase, class II
MIVHIKKLVQEAVKNNFALGAFNTCNLEITQGIIKGAVKADSGAIIQVTPSSIKYASLPGLVFLFETLAKNQGKNIPFALHLDHGQTYQEAKECIQAGFSSVMIDASDKSFKENVNLTQKVVKYAHQKKVWVQAELGQVSKGKRAYQKLIKRPEDFCTDPDQAQEFVKKTKVDTLAVAIGNIHGPYKIKHGVPRLILSQLKEIQKKVNLPLVLHGASGVSLVQLRKALDLGIKIVNIDTEIRMAWRSGVENYLKNKEEYDPRKILSPAIKNISQVVFQKIKFLKQN